MSDPGVPLAEPAVKPATVAYDRLQALAAADVRQPAPYDYAEFVRRRATRAAAHEVRRTRLGRVTALAASLSVVLIGTAIWRQAGQGTAVTAVPTVAAVAQPLDESSPALVSAGQLVARDALEERIALLDAMLSESRAAGMQADTLRALERGRSTLADSLQRVAYAHQLIGP
jgi:hypothetical protein